MNQLSTAKRAQVIGALVEGNSINSTCRMLGVGKHTVLRLLEDAGSACVEYHDEHVRGVTSQRIQADEVWSFVGAKMKNASEEKVAQGWGDVWTWTAIDADSKLIVSYLVGQRGAYWANEFLKDVASRVSNRIQLTTDGHHVYVDAVERALGSEVDYAMLIKLYGNHGNPETRYSPGECIGTESKVLMGNPDPKHISTSYVERSNLSMRMGMRRFTRLTNGFSKKLANHAHSILTAVPSGAFVSLEGRANLRFRIPLKLRVATLARA
jgi:IS1 family transposase